MKSKIFVYGSLKKGFPLYNAGWGEIMEYVGDAHTMKPGLLFTLNRFVPGISFQSVRGPSMEDIKSLRGLIKGQVFSLHADAMAHLSRMEVGAHYFPRIVDVSSGETCIAFEYAYLPTEVGTYVEPDKDGFLVWTLHVR